MEQEGSLEVEAADFKDASEISWSVGSTYSYKWHSVAFPVDEAIGRKDNSEIISKLRDHAFLNVPHSTELSATLRLRCAAKCNGGGWRFQLFFDDAKLVRADKSLVEVDNAKLSSHVEFDMAKTGEIALDSVRSSLENDESLPIKLSVIRNLASHCCKNEAHSFRASDGTRLVSKRVNFAYPDTNVLLVRSRQSGQGELVKSRNHLTYKNGHLHTASGSTSSRTHVQVGGDGSSGAALKVHSLFSLSFTHRRLSRLAGHKVVQCGAYPVARSLMGLSTEAALDSAASAYTGQQNAVCAAGPVDAVMASTASLFRLLNVNLQRNKDGGVGVSMSINLQSVREASKMAAAFADYLGLGPDPAVQAAKLQAGQEMLFRAATLGARALELLLIDSIRGVAVKINDAVGLVADFRDKMKTTGFKDLCTYLDPVVNKVVAYAKKLVDTCDGVINKKKALADLYVSINSTMLAVDPKAKMADAKTRSDQAAALATQLYTDMNTLVGYLSVAPTSPLGDVLKTISDQWALLKSKGVNLFQFTFRKKWGSCKWAWAEASGGMTVRLPGSSEPVNADQVLMPMLDFHADLLLRSKHRSINLVSLSVKAQVSKSEFSVSPSIGLLGNKIETKAGMSVSDFTGLIGKGFSGLASALPCFTATAQDVTNSLRRAAQSLLKSPESRAWMNRQAENIAALAKSLQGMVQQITDSVASFTQWLSTVYIPAFITTRVSAALASAVAALIKAPKGMVDDLSKVVIKMKDYIFLLSNDLSPANYNADPNIDAFLENLDGITGGAAEAVGDAQLMIEREVMSSMSLIEAEMTAEQRTEVRHEAQLRWLWSSAADEQKAATAQATAIVDAV